MDGPSIGSVHISHAPQDADYVRQLVDHLTGAGIPATYDREPEAALPKDVVRAKVDVSRGVIVVMSPAAKDAPRVRAQHERADELGVPVVPLLLDGEPFFGLANLEYTDVTGGRMPPAYLVERLRGIALGRRGADPAVPPPAPVTEIRQDAPGPAGRSVPVSAFIGVVVLLLLVAGVALWANRDHGGPGPGPTATGLAGSGPAPSTGAPPATSPPPVTGGATGTVQITAPVPDAVVPRCVQLAGTADLPGDKTMLFATNRTNPPAAEWYFSYAAGFRNGFVDKTWKGQIYLGGVTKQSYDVFVVVMDVQAAATFYTAHLSSDGKFAHATALPPDGKVAAHVKVLQGSNDEC
jgi:hypothetical protein